MIPFHFFLEPIPAQSWCQLDKTKWLILYTQVAQDTFYNEPT